MPLASRSHRVPPRSAPFGAAFFLLALALAGRALAAEDSAGEQELTRVVESSRRLRLRERPFGFVVDASTPAAGVSTMGYAFGIGSGLSADRPLPASLAAANGSHGFSLGHGITDRVEVFASAAFTQSTTETTAAATAMAGAKVLLTPPGAPLAVSVSAAAVREGATGATGVSALAAVSLDQGPLRLAANLRADRTFAAGRDAVDAITTAGLSYRALSALRLGVEYVGQDLEDAFGGDAEGGARHAAGPSAALSLDDGRYQLDVATAFGLNAKAPRALLRAGLTVAF